MLKSDFVAVAIDQWYERRQKDTKGRFYRRIAAQGPRNDFEKTTQGHYLCGADGTLLGFNSNHVDLDRIKVMMRKAIREFDPTSYDGVKALYNSNADSSFEIAKPSNGLVVRVYSKILGGYDVPQNAYEKYFQKSIGQDALWIRADEKAALVRAVENNESVPPAIANRIARFNLVDNTRGEPDRWTQSQIESIHMEIEDGVVKGAVKLGTADGKRGYHAELRGHIKTKGGEVVQFDVVALGKCWGEGRFTGSGPAGKFPLAITFRLVDDEKSGKFVPHGAKGWIDGYYQTDEN